MLLLFPPSKHFQFTIILEGEAGESKNRALSSPSNEQILFQDKIYIWLDNVLLWWVWQQNITGVKYPFTYLPLKLLGYEAGWGVLLPIEE